MSDITIKSAKTKDKPYKLADGGGLYLEVMPTGSKLWRMKFRQANGEESRLAFQMNALEVWQWRNASLEARKLDTTELFMLTINEND